MGTLSIRDSSLPLRMTASGRSKSTALPRRTVAPCHPPYSHSIVLGGLLDTS